MPQLLGAHNPRLQAVRALLSKKGRHEQQKFSFEGLTLVQEARASGVPLEALYLTQDAYDTEPSIVDLERAGTSMYILDDRSFARISDLQTPSGVLGITSLRFACVPDLLQEPGLVLVLADLNDPGNAGTLVRSAEAFGITRVIFGSLGVEPYHPKVVRSTMGSIFRTQVAVAGAGSLRKSAMKHRFAIVGTDIRGKRIDQASIPERALLVLGNERHGLSRWSEICDDRVGIPMKGRVESLNAAVAGSILLYEATKRVGA